MIFVINNANLFLQKVNFNKLIDRLVFKINKSLFIIGLRINLLF